MKKITSLILSTLILVSLLTACGGGSKLELSILSGSENRELEPILQEFTKDTGIVINMHYKGSVDIMNELKSGAVNYDAVWPANSIWIAMGDDHKLVRHEKSIMASPVVFGIRKSLAESLGFVGRDVSIRDILAATESGELNFAMTSATQSNSGACAYFGFLAAMMGKNTPITSDDLKDPGLQADVKRLLSGVNRSSGSSEWLRDLLVEASPFEGLDAMVNYECLVITANQDFIAQGREPLYVVYPYDGMSLADSPLGYVNHGDEEKEEAFLKLQEYLTSDEMQNRLNDLGRRTNFDLSVDNPNRAIWNPDWGINTDRTLSFISLPEKSVIFEALNLYQTALRKPSATVYCLDFSGSMAGEGYDELIKALSVVFDQNTAATMMLQNSPEDYTAVITFSNRILDTMEVYGNSQEDMQALYQWVRDQKPTGGTDIYTPATVGIEMLEELDDTYMKAVVLMTDGESNAGMSASEFAYYINTRESTIPVFSIMFGDASDTQLKDIAGLTKARVFDGRTDLIAAFKQVRGYN